MLAGEVQDAARVLRVFSRFYPAIWRRVFCGVCISLVSAATAWPLAAAAATAAASDGPGASRRPLSRRRKIWLGDSVRRRLGIRHRRDSEVKRTPRAYGVPHPVRQREGVEVIFTGLLGRRRRARPQKRFDGLAAPFYHVAPHASQGITIQSDPLQFR